MIEVIIPALLLLIPLQREMIPKINPTKQKPSPHRLPKKTYAKAIPIKGIDINININIGAKLKHDAITGMMLSFRNFMNPMIIPKTTRAGPSTGV